VSSHPLTRRGAYHPGGSFLGGAFICLPTVIVKSSASSTPPSICWTQPGYLTAISSYWDTVPDVEALRTPRRMNEMTRDDVGDRVDCYIGENNNEVARQLVKDMGAGAGSTKCFVCEGSGRFHSDDNVIALCVNCDGTGKVLVSV
jgi:hypothetical protein